MILHGISGIQFFIIVLLFLVLLSGILKGSGVFLKALIIAFLAWAISGRIFRFVLDMKQKENPSNSEYVTIQRQNRFEEQTIKRISELWQEITKLKHHSESKT